MRRLLVCGLLAISAASCGTEKSAIEERRASLTGSPTLLSTSPCADAILERVADAEQILSVSRYSHDEQSASAKVRWAKRFPANDGTAEEIIGAKPDFVIAGAHSGVRDACQQAGRAEAGLCSPP